MGTTADIIGDALRRSLTAARDDEVGVYRMIKQLVATTIKESADASYELIQNGFDAHPKGLGTARSPFTSTNRKVSTASSMSPTADGRYLRATSFVWPRWMTVASRSVRIGNKGVGFKSVFQVCDAPEVYSPRISPTPASQGSLPVRDTRRPRRLRGIG